MFFSALVVALPLLATSVSAHCSRTYTVAEGDTCDEISAAKNSSTWQLAVTNIETINEPCSNLQIGKEICLGYTSQDCTSTYVVQQGDYCDLISSKFATNTTMLRANNPQIDDLCYNLYPGEVLCVANELLVTPAPEGWKLRPSWYGDASEDKDEEEEHQEVDNKGGDKNEEEYHNDVDNYNQVKSVDKEEGKNDDKEEEGKNDDKEEEDKDDEDCDDDEDEHEEEEEEEEEQEQNDDDLPYCDEIGEEY